MDDGPNVEGPNRWGEVRLLDVFVDGPRGDHSRDVRHQEKEVGKDISGLEETFFVVCMGHFGCASLGWGGGAVHWA